MKKINFNIVTSVIIIVLSAVLITIGTIQDDDAARLIGFVTLVGFCLLKEMIYIEKLFEVKEDKAANAECSAKIYGDTTRVYLNGDTKSIINGLANIINAVIKENEKVGNSREDILEVLHESIINRSKE